MKPILIALLAMPFFALAQKKQPKIEIGPVVGMFLPSETEAFGGNLNIRGTIDKSLQAGVGFMPIWIKGANAPFVPTYLDVRLAFSPAVALIVQPGYNVYSDGYMTSGRDFSFRTTISGGFYGGAGLSFTPPTKTKAGPYLQLKYNYIGTKVTTTGRVSRTSSVNATARGKNEAVTLGVGVRF